MGVRGYLWRMTRPARTETFEHTISGLLTKRGLMFQEAERARDRIAEIRNDVAALDRVLLALGYTGDLDAAMPRQKHERLFGKGELYKGVMDEIRLAREPMTSRDIARGVVSLQGHDARDRKLLTEITRRVSKVLRIAKHDGIVKASQDSKGNMLWSVVR